MIGTNDRKQIVNQNFKRPLVSPDLVKKEANKRFDDDKIQTVRNCMDSRVVICIFGKSLGDIDKMWWNHVCKWL